MNKFDQFVIDFDSSKFHFLPKFIRRRVDALKKLQLEHINIQQQYNKELQELELKYEKLYKPLYDKRFEIITGEHEPTDEECQLPATIVDNDFDGDQENIANSDEVTSVFTEDDEASLKSKVKGLPGFWLGCLGSSYNFNDSIEKYDRNVLKHLIDIRLVYGEQGEHLTYKLEFHFEDNPHFTNKVLTKTYYLKIKPDEKDPFSYEGFEVSKSEGCEINWNPGKDVTTKFVVVKQQNKNDGRTRSKKKEVERDSFFYFFKPPQMPEGGEDEIDEDLGTIMAVDFELGEIIRHSIIPRAPLYYTGYLIDDDDDEDDEDDEDGLDDDDSDDDSDESIQSSDESTDSLNARKDKNVKKNSHKSS